MKRLYIYVVFLFSFFNGPIIAQNLMGDDRSIIRKLNEKVTEYQLYTTPNHRKLIFLCYYYDGAMDSICTAYYKNGRTKYEERWEKGYLIERLSFFDKNGIPLNPGKISEGTGKIFGYDKKGHILYEYSYKNGLKDGESKYYSKDGSILYIDKYKNDTLVLKFEYNKGHVAYETPISDGKRNGVSKVFNKNGEVIFYLIYKNGVCIKRIEDLNELNSQ